MAVQQTEAPKDAVAGILVELGASGIRLSVDDGRLKVNAPKGALNDALKTAIASYREEIIARLRADRLQGSEGRKLHHVLRKPPLPLTAVQKRFWFLDRIGQGQSVPNVNLSVTFERSNRLRCNDGGDHHRASAPRNPALCVSVIATGSPIPRFAAAPEDLVTVVDLTALPDAERERHGERLSKELMLEAFDLVTGPLAKVLFVRLSPTDNLVTFSMHHIVADGWSSSILLRELGAVYSAVNEGQQARPASLALSVCRLCRLGGGAGSRRSVRAAAQLLERKAGRRSAVAGPPDGSPSAHAALIPWQPHGLYSSRQTWCCVCSNSAKVMTPRSS